MKKNSILVKLVLMSTLTVGTMFGFTACSDDSDLMKDSANAALEKDYNGPALAPLGLSFQDFITPNDVQILNADTTQISVSKALAEKLGIKSFVGHPMGIWQNMEDDSYMRKAVREQLVGDRYILNVVPASLAELLNGQSVRLSSDLYVNTDAQSVRSRAASENIPEYAAKYIDEENMIHPMAVTILPSADGEQNPTRSGISAFGTFSTEDIMMARMSGSRWWPWSEIKKAAKAVYDWTKDKTTYNIREYHRDKSLIQASTEFSKKIEFGVGKKKEKKDTFNVNVKVPIDFALNYTFILDAKGSLVSLPNLNRFETSVAGTFDFAPQVTLGFSKKFEIPDDKQRLKLHDFPTVKLKFSVGPVPVTIDIQPYLFLKFEAEVSGSAYMGVKYHYASHFKFGAAYTNDWGLIKSYDTDENKVTMIPPTGQFKAHAGVGLMLGCDVIIEKLAGPKIAIGPKLTADAELKFSPDVKDSYFKSSVDFGVVGEIGAKLKVWKWELADWQTEVKFGKGYNIFHYNFPHEEGDEANGSFDNVLRLLNPYKNL
ncbi:MAG: hypothetical protein J6W05_01950 [Prevotella sp.]|nr:hypothetical protein [Prevotella sp.]